MPETKVSAEKLHDLWGHEPNFPLGSINTGKGTSKHAQTLPVLNFVAPGTSKR